MDNASRRKHYRSLVRADEVRPYVEQPEHEFLHMLSWLPLWARPRLVMKLALSYAREECSLPLGLVAGRAIPLVLTVAVAKLLFSVCYMVLVWQLSVCPDEGAVPVYPWPAWLAWLPFQFVMLALEVRCFETVAVPKIQVLGIPTLPFGRKCPFALWFCFRLTISVLTSMDFTSDAAFAGLQLKMMECTTGHVASRVWQQYWHQSLIGRMGLADFVPGMQGFSLIAWSFNVIPVCFALLHSVPSGLDLDCDYAIVHDACPGSMAVGEYVHFDDNGKPVVHPHFEWKTKYSTCLTPEQNSGNALMSLADAHGMELVTFNDIDYALGKAQRIYDQAEGNSMDVLDLKAAKKIVEHLMGQVRRITQHSLLSAALTNGVQMNLQMTTLGIFIYDGPDLTASHFQALFSIATGAFMLCFETLGALWLLRESYAWLAKVEELESRLTPGEIINGNPQEMPSAELRRAVRCLFIGFLLCSFIIGFATAKFIGLLECPYSLWSFGCFDGSGFDRRASN